MVATSSIIPFLLLFVVSAVLTDNECPEELEMLMQMQPEPGEGDGGKIKSAECFEKLLECFYDKVKLKDNSDKKLLDKMESCATDLKDDGEKFKDYKELYTFLKGMEKNITVIKDLVCCNANVLAKAGIGADTQLSAGLECYSMNPEVEECVQNQKNE